MALNRYFAFHHHIGCGRAAAGYCYKLLLGTRLYGVVDRGGDNQVKSIHL